MLLMAEVYDRDGRRSGALRDSSIELMRAARKKEIHPEMQALKRYAKQAQKIWFEHNGIPGLNGLQNMASEELKLKKVTVNTPTITTVAPESATVSSSVIEHNRPRSGV